jgi:hypothetical protein
MEDDFELMNVVTVGGNAVSAFLSWRLQATNACDVTLVWKSGFDHVAQYGISFKSVHSRLVKSSRVAHVAQRAPRLWAARRPFFYSLSSLLNICNRTQIIGLWERAF